MSRAAGRGRRRGGPDTRGAILEAARASFAGKGFTGTTIRGVAADAGVDSALVHHYFGSKDDLFLAALELPIDPRELVHKVFGEGVDGAAERLLRIFFSVWDDPQLRQPLVALVRAGLAGDTTHSLLKDGILSLIFAPVAEALGEAESRRRAQLVASQMLGLIIARYVVKVEPLASMPPEELVAWMAPNIQRYLTGPHPDSAAAARREIGE
ncbi:MAG TPA: TetR family transcriptional regulator [Nocardioidaceae bacterium]|nr:TetR family transcriptional regulator [Nocardioidaceae bacterium]